MTIRLLNARLVSAAAALLLAGAVGGCASAPTFLGGTSRKATFSNASDSPLNVSFYVEAPASDEQGKPVPMSDSNEFVLGKTFQITRGETASYTVPRAAAGSPKDFPIVHIRVQPVGPSWNSTSTEYWLEMLTDPPVSVFATGTADSMTFDTGNGAVALIPQSEIKSGRFDHQVVTVTEQSQ